MRRKLAVLGNLAEFFFVAPVGENDDDVGTRGFKLLSAVYSERCMEAESEIVVVDGQFLIFFMVKRGQESDNFSVGVLVGMGYFKQKFRKSFGGY